MQEKTISLMELQQMELEMLKDLHMFCEDNQLTYALGYGTCLGAVRHNGFIPWDDDIDIIMPYPDYKKLIELKRGLDSRYRIYSIETDGECPYTFAKYIDTYTELDEMETVSKPIGVYIDIFPVYGLPKGKVKFRLYSLRLKLNSCFMVCARKREYTGKTAVRSLVQRVIGPYAKRKGVGHYVKRMLRIVREYDYEKSDIVSCTPEPNWKETCFSRSMLENMEKHKFEDGLFYLPNNADKYLKINYGDYMKLPPKEQQVSHHKYTVRFKNEKGKKDL